MNADYPSVAMRAGHRCEYCRAPEAAFNFNFEVDHIIPSSAGGTDDLSNLALSCRSCNAFKSMRGLGFDRDLDDPVALFNPRRETWEAHFEVDINDLIIIGRTPIGRATVTALRLNSPRQLQARINWRRLEMFPSH